MALLSLNLPVIGQSSATEDQKVRDALSSLQTLVNGNIDEANVPNLAAAFTTWKTVLWGGSTPSAAQVVSAGPWLMSGGGTPGATSAVSSVGAANTAGFTFPLDPVDWLANARATKMRIRWRCVTNAVAPGINLIPGLYPVTTFAGAGGAGPSVSAIGAVVAGSTATFTTPGANTATTTLSSEFNAPAAGDYVFGLSTGGAMAASSFALIVAHLQIRQV